MPDLFDEFAAMVEALAQAGVPFAVCGGLALAIHARPRATVDIDLLAPPEAVADVIAVAGRLGFEGRLRGPVRLAAGAIIMHRLTKMVPGDPEVLILGVIEAGEGVAAAAWADRVETRWRGVGVPVVSPAGLIALKRLRGSAQDVADIEALEGGA
jgi:hypothetical protein